MHVSLLALVGCSYSPADAAVVDGIRVTDAEVQAAAPVLALDVPSGVDAGRGIAPGDSIVAQDWPAGREDWRHRPAGENP